MNEDLIIDIMAYITLGIMLSLALFMVVLKGYCEIKERKLRDEYKKNLKDEERLIIARYEDIKVHWFKRK